MPQRGGFSRSMGTAWLMNSGGRPVISVVPLASQGGCTMNTHRAHSGPQRRSALCRAAFLIASLLASLAAGACSGDAGTSGPIEVGRGDRMDNGLIAVDADKLSGSIADHTLTLAIPVSTIGSSDASGR